MTAYNPTEWINDQDPPLSAANLNRLTDELEAQASEQGITNSLPTWTDGAPPAITDPAPLNEMERVTQLVAQSVGLSYTPTTWSSGWTPARNAIRLNRLEAQAEANRAAIDAAIPPPPSTSDMALPAKFHIFGGNESSKGSQVDVLVCSYTSNANPNTLRQTNPNLKVFCHNSYNHQGKSQGFAFTYGGFLSGGGGAVNDTLQPNPQGQIRGWQSTDAGCRQSFDNLQGFADWKTATADWLGQCIYYSYKQGNFASLGYNGVWSDNLWGQSNLPYGSCGTAIPAGAWDAGLLRIFNYIRSKAGAQVYVGGNVIYRSPNPAIRAATDMALREQLNIVGGFTESSVWSDVQQMQGWLQTPSTSGNAKVPCVTDEVPSSDQARQRFGWAIATIGYEAAYCAFDGNHANSYWPSGVTRGYLGRPTGPINRSGGVWTRTFQGGTVTANWNTRTGTFA